MIISSLLYYFYSVSGHLACHVQKHWCIETVSWCRLLMQFYVCEWMLMSLTVCVWVSSRTAAATALSVMFCVHEQCLACNQWSDRMLQLSACWQYGVLLGSVTPEILTRVNQVWVDWCVCVCVCVCMHICVCTCMCIPLCFLFIYPASSSTSSPPFWLRLCSCDSQSVCVCVCVCVCPRVIVCFLPSSFYFIANPMLWQLTTC